MDEERRGEPFPTEDPRQKEIGDQLPEENPGGSGGSERQVPESDDHAPGTSSDEDSGPRTATGNPNAAG
jgi:hypothetical protein